MRGCEEDPELPGHVEIIFFSMLMGVATARWYPSGTVAELLERNADRVQERDLRRRSGGGPSVMTLLIFFRPATPSR